jgi:hypothetical protein
MEYFKPVNGYEGLYSISNYGRVYSHRRWKTKGKILKPNIDKDGYERYRLSNSIGIQKIGGHKLVGLSFVSDYFDGAVVNHIDEDKTNNHYSNLEWVSVQQNTEYSNAKKYLITFPCNKQEVVYNLNKFCRKYKLTPTRMYGLAKGVHTHHKGFKCSKH